MKTFHKKSLAWALVLSMIISMLPMAVFAEGEADVVDNTPAISAPLAPHHPLTLTAK